MSDSNSQKDMKVVSSTPKGTEAPKTNQMEPEIVVLSKENEVIDISAGKGMHEISQDQIYQDTLQGEKLEHDKFQEDIESYGQHVNSKYQKPKNK